MISKDFKPIEKGWKSGLKFSAPVTEKKKPKPIPKIGKRRKEQGSETEVFNIVWNSRPHSCEICGKYIREPKAHNFDHIIPKSRGEQYRLDPDNLKIVCFACHFKKTTGLKYKGPDLD